jgi:hypothetical protein
VSDDDDRRAILDRRKKFIAMALSGLTSIGAACADDEGTPNETAPMEPPAQLVPLEREEPAVVAQPEPEPEPEPEAEPQPEPPDMEPDMRPRPRACLRVRRPSMAHAPPRVCLLQILSEKPGGAPDDDDGDV